MQVFIKSIHLSHTNSKKNYYERSNLANCCPFNNWMASGILCISGFRKYYPHIISYCCYLSNLQINNRKKRIILKLNNHEEIIFISIYGRIISN